MEAMASGCYVIGYEGFGGKELYDKRFSTSISNSDVLRFAKAAEKAIKLYDKTPQQILDCGLRARDFIVKNYSLAKEKETVLDFWQKMLAQNIK
jgi:glycosyltransferase involved in cell wall biosynthesis